MEAYLMGQVRELCTPPTPAPGAFLPPQWRAGILIILDSQFFSFKKLNSRTSL